MKFCLNCLTNFVVRGKKPYSLFFDGTGSNLLIYFNRKFRFDHSSLVLRGYNKNLKQNHPYLKFEERLFSIIIIPRRY